MDRRMDKVLVEDRTAQADGVYVAWMVERGSADRTFMTKVGAAFLQEDGSLVVELAAIPQRGQLVLRPLAGVLS
jgi:hypothetical protein